MEMEKEHMSLRRGVSWSSGGLTTPLQTAQDATGRERGASQEMTGFNMEQLSSKTNLTRSVSLSEKELKEARLRSHIIAAQLTVASNSNSRGVQLFNRRKQRVTAFTLESSGEVSKEDIARNVNATSSSCNKLTWEERSREEKTKDLNYRNCATTKTLLVPTGGVPAAGDNMEEQGDHYGREDDTKHNVIQERHFLPVKEVEEQEEEEGEHEVKHELPPGRENPIVMSLVESEAEMNGGHTSKLPNGTDGPQKISSSPSKPNTILNRTARPFFSPLTVQIQESTSPVMENLHASSAFTAPQPVAPPPPAYPTSPLPAFTNKPPKTEYSSPPVVSPPLAPPSQSPVLQYGPPTSPKPSTLVPQSFLERRSTPPIKTGLLEDIAARRANKKSMFTFKEKPVVAPNPELLSLVQGVDERKKRGQRSIPEPPSSEEELLALGAEASNFLTKVEDKAEDAKAPEWTSCLKSARTYARVEHKPEQTLNDASGKGAELFAKRRSRMEKFVVENENPGHRMRAPSPTMSLPPSWIYPSNMPGRVKAIAKNSDICAQLAHNIKTQQSTKPKPRPPTVQVQEPPPLENGCSKIEMDLSRHRPYQLNSSLFILNPVKDPLSTLPRGAPQSRNQMSQSQSFSRQTSLPSNPVSNFSIQCKSTSVPPSHTTGAEYPASSPACGQPSAAFSASPRTGVQAPRPRFSAKKAGIEPQKPKEAYTVENPGVTKKSISADSPTWPPNLQNNRPSSTNPIRSVTSPVWFPGSRCQSPMSSQNIPLSTVSSVSKPPQTPTSPCSPPWGSRCHSPMVGSINSSVHDYKPQRSNSSRSIPWGSRSQSPVVNLQSSDAPHVSSKTSPNTSALCPPWGSRCHSPMASTSTHSATLSSLSSSRPFQTSATSSQRSPPWSPRSQSPMVIQPSIGSSSRSSKPLTTTSPVSPPWGSRSQSPALSHGSLSFHSGQRLSVSSISKDSRCMSPVNNNLDSKANHRMLAKNIINAAKRKNSPSPGALSSHSLPISPVGFTHHGYDCKAPINPFHSRPLGAQSPTFTSPPPTPTQGICSPVRLYNTRSLTDSDASIESEDSGLRSPGMHSYNTCPRGWGGSLRVKKSTISTDL
uniref:synaptopodin n=1 Tax=Doryrhamphus excisus TaxID=161450 RepID=UPI0025AE9B67|nr:synaptopodin [Doryrhamphus excisus]XP_057918999.1 synaptopodin [Doryrhamphus excisus]XP_057919000.1 synaptopodin [Doryrhamphus excisus]XP_057919001.1 synaptopodin [Doryrhamphus excisus]XP_057919002.1 synaptopodin [Doryrhamphus excisus]XP_057919003.1 synaptopodin [Doryrhamphus excisus]